MEKEDAEKLLDFLADNDVTFALPGHYGAPLWLLKKATNEFIETGKSDLIKKHMEWTHLCWDFHDYYREKWHNGLYMSLDSLKKLLELKKFWGDCSDLDNLVYSIEKAEYREELLNSYQVKRRGLTPYLKKQCLEKHNHRCKKCKSVCNLEIDHIIELIDGGSNELDNLQVLCRKCHREKTSKSIKARKKCGSQLQSTTKK